MVERDQFAGGKIGENMELTEGEIRQHGIILLVELVTVAGNAPVDKLPL